jgi:hypothetical protein
MTADKQPHKSHARPSSDTEETPRDDPVARAILDLVAALAPGRSISPVEAARAVARARARPGDPPDAWRRYLPAVRQQALHLARRGRLTILRKGKPVDPHAPVKGVVRLARASEA